MSMDVLEEKINCKKIEAGDSADLTKFLFQTGFMTIEDNKGCTTSKVPSCLLGVVNKEARGILEKSDGKDVELPS